LYAPDVLNGMHSADEVEDMPEVRDVTPKTPAANPIAALNESIARATHAPIEQPAPLEPEVLPPAPAPRARRQASPKPEAPTPQAEAVETAEQKTAPQEENTQPEATGDGEEWGTM